MGPESVRIFLGLLAGHVCGDALVYSKSVSGLKRADRAGHRVAGTLLHGFLHAVFVLVFLWPVPAGVRLWACVYVFGVHFLIDAGRVALERRVFPPDEMVILSKKDLFRTLLGRARVPVSEFFHKNMRPWLVMNLLDQGLHLASLAGFAFGVAPHLA